MSWRSPYDSRKFLEPVRSVRQMIPTCDIYHSMKREVAKVFKTGRSQAVRIPKRFRFATDEVLIERDGDSIVLTPRPRSWKEYFATAPRLPADFPKRIHDRAPENVEPL
jgi:antitoxin VapB